MKRFQELISKYVDDTAMPGEEAELARFLATNSGNMQEFLACYEIDQLLAVLHTPASDGAIDAIVAQIRSEEHPFVRSVFLEIHAVPPRSRLTQAVHSFASRLAQAFAFPSTVARRSAWVGLAACLTLLVGAWLFMLREPVPVVARSMQGKGEITVEHLGNATKLTSEMKLGPGDVLKTSTNGSAVITYARESTRIIISPDTSLRVLSWKEGKRFELRQGRIEATVAHQPTARPMVWQTAQAEATVLGTELALEVVRNTTTLEVFNGKVKLTSQENGQSIQLTNNQYAVAAAGSDLQAQLFRGGRGTILREYWLGVAGIHVGSLTHDPSYPNKPSGSEYATRFGGPTKWGTNYGSRFRGYLHPPETGEYTFWITANECAQLWLSSDERADQAVMVASLSQPAPPGRWDTYRWQKSNPIKLQSGRKYYIEALHKASDNGGDHCSVAWQVPGRKREVIAGEFLSPVKSETKKANP